MTTTTSLDLDAIKARLAAIAPAPWYAENVGSTELPMWEVSNDAFVNPTDANDGCAINVIVTCGVPADAEFIAAARQDVPALVVEVERLVAELVEERRQHGITAQVSQVRSDHIGDLHRQLHLPDHGAPLPLPPITITDPKA